MPHLITKTAHRIEVELSAEEQLLLWFRAHRGSWRTVLTWLRRNTPHRMAEIQPIIRRLQAFERRYRVRLEAPLLQKPG